MHTSWAGGEGESESSAVSTPSAELSGLDVGLDVGLDLMIMRSRY